MINRSVQTSLNEITGYIEELEEQLESSRDEIIDLTNNVHGLS